MWNPITPKTQEERKGGREGRRKEEKGGKKITFYILYNLSGSTFSWWWVGVVQGLILKHLSSFWLKQVLRKTKMWIVLSQNHSFSPADVQVLGELTCPCHGSEAGGWEGPSSPVACGVRTLGVMRGWSLRLWGGCHKHFVQGLTVGSGCRSSDPCRPWRAATCFPVSAHRLVLCHHSTPAETPATFSSPCRPHSSFLSPFQYAAWVVPAHSKKVLSFSWIGLWDSRDEPSPHLQGLTPKEHGARTLTSDLMVPLGPSLSFLFSLSPPLLSLRQEWEVYEFPFPSLMGTLLVWSPLCSPRQSFVVTLDDLL